MVRARGLLGPAFVVIVLAASGAALVRGDTSVRDVAAYGLYFLGCVALPGVLAYRALRGPGPWWEDVAMGAAFGLCLELISWAVLTSLHLQRWLIVPPILSLALLAHPHNRLRRNTQAGVDRWPAWLVASVGVSMLFVVATLARGDIGRYPDRLSSEPPYIDLLWHGGLVAEAGRSLPLTYPEATLAGPVHHHWFSDAHLSVAHQIAGVPIDTILSRTYFLPLCLLTILGTAALARSVARSHVAAALAGWLVISSMTLPWWPRALSSYNIFAVLSPSQVYSAPILLLAVASIAAVLRQPSSWQRWVIAVVAALSCTGAKASALALLVCGLLLASVAMLVQRRQVRLVLVLAVGLGLVVAAAGPFLAGGTLGSHPQLLANLGRLPLFRMVNGALPDTGTLVPAGFFGPGGQGIAFLVLLLSLQLVQAAKVWVWLPAVAALPRVRQDPMSWVLAGMALGGLGAVLTLFHPGGSAFYFMYGALPFGSVLGAWLAAEALDGVGPDRSRVLARRSLLAGVGLSLLGAAVIWRLPVPSTGHGMTTLSAVTMGVLVVLCLVIAAWVWRRGGFRDPARRQQSIGALAAGLVGAMVVSGPLLAVASPPSPRTPGASAKTGSVKPASPPPVSWVDRMRVGEYADSHLPDDALLATNAHCTEYAMPTGCRAAQFWVSGFTLRQVLVSGWAYSTAANKDQTFTQPEALAKNDAFFSAPSRSGLDYLRSQGVTYVVASLSNGPVSPAIASYADMVMRTPTVWLLKLKS